MAEYYTPELNELHISFECEVLANDAWLSAKVNLTSFKQGVLDGFEMLSANTPMGGLWIKESNLNQIRVKHLDEADIIELGFVQDSINSFRKEDWILEVCLSEMHRGKDTLDLYLVSDLRFKGTIKNKNELRIILKQTGVIK